MASALKLTRLIARRTFHGSNGVQADNVFTVTFDDGSILRVKTAVPGSPGPAVTPTGGTIKKVRQKGTELNLDLEDGTTLTLHTAEATASVMLRDKAGKLEYAD